MSASNWTACPRCLHEAKRTVAEAQARVDALYGKVSVDSFDEARAALPTVESLTENQPTFREDYETYGASSGTVTYTYGGTCTVCKLEVKRRDEHTFWEPPA